MIEYYLNISFYPSRLIGIPDWLVVVIVPIYILYSLVTYKSDYWSKAGVRHTRPRLLPMIKMFFKPMDMASFDKLGSVFGTLFGIKPLLMVADPAFVKEITVKQFSNFTNRDTSHSLNDSTISDHFLVDMNNSKWKGMRNAVSPTFSAAKMKAHVPLLNKCARTLVDNLNVLSKNGKSGELRAYCAHYLLDTMGVALYGVHIDSSKESMLAAERRKANRHYKDDTFYAHAHALISRRNPLAMLTSVFPCVRKCLQKLGFQVQWYADGEHMDFFKSAIQSMVDEKRKNEEDQTSQKRVDMLAVLLDAYNENAAVIPNDTNDEHDVDLNVNKRDINMDELVANSIFFFVGGYDTTVTSLEWTLFLLANNTHVQKKLYSEISQKIVNKNDITYNNIDALEYLDCVINESLRIYPPAFAIDRVCNKNTNVLGIELHKDDWIIMSVYAIHHNEKYWPNPYEFRPERFMSEEKASITPYSFLPWGSGSRNCIGQRLAYLVVKISIVHVLRQFELTVDTDKTQVPIKLAKGFGMIRANGGLHLHFNQR